MIKLTQGQDSAFSAFKKAVNTTGAKITIRGAAGTGKTTLTKTMLNWAVSEGISGINLAAPTHQAKKVLSKLSGFESNTIHSLMKINPTTYEENQIFEQREIPDMSKCRVLVCDEASMYDNKLFDIILNSMPSWCTVVGLGDLYQLRPVTPGEFTPQISRFFTDPRFEQHELDEVMRSNAPIITVATDIRKGNWIHPYVEDGEGVHQFVGGNAIKDFMINFFRKVKTAEDLFENRILAFTNKSVDRLNQIVRRNLYKTDEPFIVGEVLVMQEPLMLNIKFEGKQFKEIIFNNGENVRIHRIQPAETPLMCRNVGNVTIKYYKLEVESIDEDNEGTKTWINVIADPEQRTRFEMFLGKAAGEYKSGNGKAYWADFWDAKNKFVKIKALPASTIHKAQGVSMDNTFLYTPCIHNADAEMAQQLLYVGATRARRNVYYV
ncbi:Dda-like helicase [Serratia phage 92A1]|nr:Dda-like helicase [Serratia phage 92A1]